MNENELSRLGPVDYLVVEFPAGQQNFTGEMAQELLGLVEAGTIRLIDAIVLTKDEGWRHALVWEEGLWPKAVHRVVTEGISPEQAVDEALARTKQILSE